jgi:hypothetical protein
MPMVLGLGSQKSWNNGFWWRRGNNKRNVTFWKVK